MCPERLRDRAFRGAMVLLCTFASSLFAQNTNPNPIVTAGVNGQAQLTTFQGWPLIVTLSVIHPQLWDRSGQAIPILIASTTGRWADTLRPTVRNASGNPVPWPLRIVPVLPGSLTLDGLTAGRLTWTLAPSFTASIPAGTYLINGVLNTTLLAPTMAWKGMSTSSAVMLTIAPEPSPLTPDQVEQKYISLAAFHSLIGNSTQAMADLATLGQQLPGNIGAASAKAQLLEFTGQTAAAINAYDQAVDLVFQQYPNAPEPPISLLNARQQLIAAGLSGSGKVGKPQITIATLGTGLQSPGVLYVDLKITNTGTGTASDVMLGKFVFRTLSGGGIVGINSDLTPLLPLHSQLLAPGSSVTERVYLNIPTSVLRFSMAEQGTVTDIVGTPYGFAAAQALIP